MKRWLFYLILLLIGVTFNNCSTTNLTSGGNNTYTLNLGDVEEDGIQKLVTRIRNIYHYEIERNDQYRSTEAFIRTYWKKSLPFTNDPTYEANEIETRITLRSKLKTRQGYKMYSIKFTGEYRASLPNEDGRYEFQSVELTPEAVDYFRDIAYDLKDRVQGSIRGN